MDSGTRKIEEILRDQVDKDAINNFREYLRIQSVHPNINYDECILFLQNQAKSLDLPYRVYKCAPDKPLLIITWMGTEPNLPSIWLNSHMDVVPAYEEKWTYKPFDAHMDEQGNIYARGAQDMKSIAIQYLEAIRRLRRNNVTLRRTIHIAFVPEEEVLSFPGMKNFTESVEFRDLNVGFALDEGLPSENHELSIHYDERLDWKLRVHCTGEPGHGLILVPDPPGEKMSRILRKFSEFRTQQVAEYLKNPTYACLGSLISINLTMLEGGVQANVVPNEFIATYDVRLPSTVDLDEFERTLDQWCKEAGDGVWIEFKSKEHKIPQTKTDDSNPYWMAIMKTMEDMKITIVPSILAGSTDARCIRMQGIPAAGFSPIYNTVVKVHENDEYLNAEVFLKGIDIYTRIIPAIANVE